MRASLPFSRWCSALSLLATPLLAGFASAGLNPHFTIPLHYKVSSFEACDGFLPVDCAGTRPTVTAMAGEPAAVYVLVHNYAAFVGIQTAFEWDRSWNLLYGLWDCHQGGLDGLEPVDPGGPTYGSLNKVFVCINGPALAVIGRMFFVGVESGCIRQVQPTYQFGICLLDCTYALDQIFESPTDQGRLGQICVGSGGHDACDLVLPVEAATWGRIKATYGHD